MRRPKHRARRRTALLAPVVWLALVAGAGQIGILAVQAAPPVDSPGPPSADGVQPVIADTQSSNDDCGQLGFDHGISIAGNGQASSGAMTVTVSGYNSPTGFADWSSNLPIHGVYVKGGPSGGNLFNYPAGDTGDQDLHTPQKSGRRLLRREPSRPLLERRGDRSRRLDRQGERSAGRRPARRLDHLHAHRDERRRRHRDRRARHGPTPGGCDVRRCHRGVQRGCRPRHVRARRHRRRRQRLGRHHRDRRRHGLRLDRERGPRVRDERDRRRDGEQHLERGHQLRGVRGTLASRPPGDEDLRRRRPAPRGRRVPLHDHGHERRRRGGDRREVHRRAAAR